MPIFGDLIGETVDTFITKIYIPIYTVAYKKTLGVALKVLLKGW
jgi:hypothetical protein